MRLRCIAIVSGIRCSHPAAFGNGNLYCCTGHGRIQLAIIEDCLPDSAVRKMLTRETWETRAEGQALIDNMRAGAAA